MNRMTIYFSLHAIIFSNFTKLMENEGVIVITVFSVIISALLAALFYNEEIE